MSKKSLKLGIALAAGAGAAAVLAKNSKCNPGTSKASNKSASSKNPVNSDYRNTERGKYEKTAKVSITQTETTKHSPARKNRKVLTTNMHTS